MPTRLPMFFFYADACQEAKICLVLLLRNGYWFIVGWAAWDERRVKLFDHIHIPPFIRFFKHDVKLVTIGRE